MKEKEPNRSIFSAEDSPVPLPSVEEAWSDMRKRLDEEMPERVVFFWIRRGALLVLLLLLSFGAFLLIRRTGEATRSDAGRSIVHANDNGRDASGQGKGDRSGEKEVDRPDPSGRTIDQGKGRAMDQREGRAMDQRKGGAADQREGEVVDRHEEKKGNQPNGAAEQGKGGVTDSGKRAMAYQPKGAAVTDHRKGGVTYQPKGGVRDHRKEGGGSGERATMEGSGNLRSAGTRTNDLHRVVIDPRVAHTGTPDPIRVKVDMPRRTAGTGKKNAPMPEPGKSAKKDSTRILWAAGLQDSKSFPIGAQQSYNYDANLKKDLWADYIPSPYFQYHISRKIAFQTALQLNNPQYTESVTIFRKAGDSSGGVQITNDTTVTVRKLYYFNIPFLVYYSPLRNLYLGAGLQFSNLRNGIAFQNNVIHHVGTSSLTDTVTTSTVISLKENRPAYNNLRTTDWRVLFEINYYWKRVTLGIQYQQALGNYLYTPVEGSSGRDRNSSFNVYLRYNLWERRVRIAPAKN